MTDKAPQVKKEETGDQGQEIIQISHANTNPNQNKNTNIYFDHNLLLKNHFDPFLCSGLSMSNRTGMIDPYRQFYSYDPYYANFPYNMSMSMSTDQTNKPCIDNFSMARTNGFFNTSSNGMHLPFPQSFNMEEEPNSSNLFNKNRKKFWVEDRLQDKSEEPSIDNQENIKEQKRLQKKRKEKLKNETKNIPKNYGKAMISFILSHLDWIQSQFGIEKRNELIAELKKRKNTVNAIIHLKDLWTTSKYSKQFRVLSNLFLRKFSFAYIFNSRVANYSTHIKYKYKLQQALKIPGDFFRIKQF